MSNQDSETSTQERQWTVEAASAMAQTFEGSFVGDRVIVAATAVTGSQAGVRYSTNPPAVNSRYAIGSVTKTLTGTLLAAMVVQGTVKLDDGIGRWLSAGQNSDITVLQLATHTAGIPRLPQTRVPQGPAFANPYLDFTEDRAESELRRTQRQGPGYQYSNFGYQLLGLALERAAGKAFAELLADMVLHPLGMYSSGIAPSGSGDLLPGHAEGQATPQWEQPLPAAGAIEATVVDLGRYLRAYLCPLDTPLAAALLLAATPHAGIDSHRAVGLGWNVRDGHLLTHTGETAGSSCAVVVDRDRDRGAAVAVNSGAGADALQRAAYLAVMDGDVGSARPTAPGPHWSVRAEEVVHALVDGRAREVHASMTSELRARVSSDDLSATWMLRTVGAGALTGVVVSCRSISGGIAADTTVEFENQPLRLALAFNARGELARLMVLRAAESPPW